MSDYDPHWLPMYVQCLPCHIQYTVTARLETLATDSRYILQTIGVNDMLPISHRTGHHHSRSLVEDYYHQIGQSGLCQVRMSEKFFFFR